MFNALHTHALQVARQLGSDLLEVSGPERIVFFDNYGHFGRKPDRNMGSVSEPTLRLRVILRSGGMTTGVRELQLWLQYEGPRRISAIRPRERFRVEDCVDFGQDLLLRTGTALSSPPFKLFGSERRIFSNFAGAKLRPSVVSRHKGRCSNTEYIIARR
jgi:hypothetical protein